MRCWCNVKVSMMARGLGKWCRISICMCVARLGSSSEMALSYSGPLHREPCQDVRAMFNLAVARTKGLCRVPWDAETSIGYIKCGCSISEEVGSYWESGYEL